jgi:hypothetical protein
LIDFKPQFDMTSVSHIKTADLTRKEHEQLVSYVGKNLYHDGIIALSEKKTREKKKDQYI